MQLCTLLAVLSMAPASTSLGGAEKPYDFRSSPAYKALKPEQQQALEQMHRDFVLLWGTLDLYLRDHDGRAPERLEALVPRCLKEVPRDPFATKEIAAEKKLGSCSPFLAGWGYRHRRGEGDSVAIASVGLPDFPYLAESGNVGLCRPRGLWLSGEQPVQK